MELIKVKKAKDGTITLNMSGELTIFKVSQLKSEFEEILKANDCESVKLNLSEVSDLDTACYQLLIQIKKYCDQNSLSFLISKSSEVVREVIDLYNMKDYFDGVKSTAA